MSSFFAQNPWHVTVAKAIATAGLVVLVASTVAAQSSLPARHLESRQTSNVVADCRARVAAMNRLAATGQDDSALVSMRSIYECDRTGPAAIAGLWQANYANSPMTINALISASASLVDARIEARATQVLTDQSRPSVMRQAAAVVLASYVRTDFRGRVERSIYRNDPLAVTVVEVGHPDATPGAEPLAPGVRARVLQVYGSLGSLSATPALRDLVKELQQEVAHN